MRLSSFTTHIMRTTAIALPLVGAPFTVGTADSGLHVAPAQAWAENDHGNGGGGHDGSGDHGSSDHGSSGGTDSQGSSNDGSHTVGQDQSPGQSRSQEQDQLAQDRDSWLGVSSQSQSSGTQTGSGGGLAPVQEDQERQLIERGWAGADAQGDHQ